MYDQPTIHASLGNGQQSDFLTARERANGMGLQSPSSRSVEGHGLGPAARSTNAFILAPDTWKWISRGMRSGFMFCNPELCGRLPALLILM